jgi:hypothetical protein
VDEREWLTSTDPQVMLAFLRDRGLLTERKARLFAVACCRRIWPLLIDEESRRAVEVAERHADGLAGQGELESAWMAAAYVADHAEESKAPAAACGATGDEPWIAARDSSVLAAQVAIGNAAGEPAVQRVYSDAQEAVWFGTQEGQRSSATREEQGQADIVRDFFGNPLRPPPLLSPSVLQWNSGTLIRLARAAYEERELPSGHLDQARLVVLADALEEAGADVELVGHLRGPGPHYRGCWCIDLLTGRQ